MFRGVGGNVGKGARGGSRRGEGLGEGRGEDETRTEMRGGVLGSPVGSDEGNRGARRERGGRLRSEEKRKRNTVPFFQLVIGFTASNQGCPKISFSFPLLMT